MDNSRFLLGAPNEGLTWIIHTPRYCNQLWLAPERNARIFLLECRIHYILRRRAALTLMHKPLPFSQQCE